MAVIAAEIPRRYVNLEKANRVRFARLELKQRILAGEIRVSEVLLNVPEAAENWAIADLLSSQWQWGDVRARRFLSAMQIGERRPVGALTRRQREAIAVRLAFPGRRAA